ncbi:DnaJ [Acrasis kona]|uniref:DnaJ n=1 Tax=Acrasis kona TaxID=1008807 RepID=A0AAW2Z966_9EUKA
MTSNSRQVLCEVYLRSKHDGDRLALLSKMIEDSEAIQDEELSLAFLYEMILYMRDKKMCYINNILPMCEVFCERCYGLGLYENAANGCSIAISECPIHNQSTLFGLYQFKSMCLSKCQGKDIQQAATMLTISDMTSKKEGFGQTVYFSRKSRRAYKILLNAEKQ